MAHLTFRLGSKKECCAAQPPYETESLQFLRHRFLVQSSSAVMSGRPWWSHYQGYPYQHWPYYPNAVWFPPQGHHQAPLEPRHRDDRRRMSPEKARESSSSPMSAETTGDKGSVQEVAAPASPTEPAGSPRPEPASSQAPEKKKDTEDVQRPKKTNKEEKKTEKEHKTRGRRQRRHSDDYGDQRRPKSPDHPPRSQKLSRQDQEAWPQDEADGHEECPTCKKWVSVRGYDNHRSSNLVCLEMQSKLEQKGEAQHGRPKDIYHPCPDPKCNKKWFKGAYALKMHLLHTGHDGSKQKEAQMSEAPVRLREARQRSRTPSSRGQARSEHPGSQYSGWSKRSKSPPGDPGAGPAPSSAAGPSGEDRADALADLFEATSRVLRTHKR